MVLRLTQSSHVQRKIVLSLLLATTADGLRAFDFLGHFDVS